MKSTWYSYRYDFESRFSNLRLEWIRGLENIHFAEMDGKYYLIYNGKAVYGFLMALADSDEEIEQIQSENYVQILEFEQGCNID